MTDRDDHRIRTGTSAGNATSPGPSPNSNGPSQSPVMSSGSGPQVVEENSRTRRGLDRLSGGLRDLGFEVLSRKQRHERDKSNGSNKSSGPKSPDFHKTSPPYSRTNTAEGDPRSPDSINPPGSATSTAPSELVRRPAHSGARSQTASKKPTFVLVTQDHEQLSKVDLNGVQSPAAIRERLYTKARVPDDDFRHCTIHLSSLEQADPGTPLDDSELWQISQGVLSGEITPAPLFFIQLAVDGSSGYQDDPSPDFPSSPYTAAPPISAHSDSYQDRYARPDSLVETSSNSSVSKPRPSVQRRPSPQDQQSQQQIPSPVRTAQSRRPTPPPQQQRKASYHSPPLEEPPPHPAFFNTDRRSSGGSLHPPSEYPELQPVWDRRSSAGESDHSRRPDFLSRPGHSRRDERQARSEAHIQSTWESQQNPVQQWQHQGQTGTPYAAAGNMQAVGMGPSGPIYLQNNPAMRPRANSANAQDAPHSGPIRQQQQQQPMRNAPPLGFGPSGPLHFPQPIHHGQPPPLPARQPPPPTIMEHPQGLMPGDASGLGMRGLSIAKSMDNMRIQGSSSQPPRPNQDQRYMAEAQRHNPYDDPRRAMRPVTAEMGRPMSQTMSSRTPSQQSQLSPNTQNHSRSPPTNSSPRVPSYPPQRPPSAPLQQMPPPQSFQNRLPPSGAHQLRNYPQQSIGDRRQHSDQHRGPVMPTALQVAPGPQRLPLQPGETLQDALHQRNPPLPPRMQKTSPQANQRTSDPRQQPPAASYEERPQSQYSSNSDAYSRQFQPRQYADEAHFTASPPAQYSEQQLNSYSQYSATPQDAYQSASMRPSRSYDNNTASNRSSSSSIEQHRSPVSSRPSTSSGPFSDRAAAERPPSFSSNSTNEIPTPVSEPGHHGLTKATAVYTEKLHSLGTSGPQIVDRDRVNDGVALLRDSIDAATSDSPEKLKSQEQAAASPSLHYLDSPDEGQSDTMKAKEWANLFVNLGDRTVGEDEDTLGKKKKQKPDVVSDEEGSTLGKAKSQTEASSNEAESPAEAKSAAPKINVPAPMTPYNPDEDDDDEAMTWAVQMQPTKPTAPKEEAPTVQSAPASESVRKEPPNSIALPAPSIQVSPMPSPRSEKPSLRVQTNVSGQQQTQKPVSKTAILDSPASSKRSASPRSASRRPRRAAKETQSDGKDPAQQLEIGEAAPASLDPGSSSVVRRLSFRDNDWAFRPPVEQVYDNLEEFFPGHDLDKPIVDASVLGPNSASPSPALDSALPSPALSKVDLHQKDPEHSPRTRHDRDTEKEPSRRFNQNRKSIRMVAQDRKSRMKKEEIVAKATLPGAKDEAKDKLARRKSTKVWGRKIEEVTPAEADLLYSAKEPMSADKERDELAPIRWVKGELIGKGTYGHVYIGFNVTNGEMIAVKQVELPRTASDKDDNRQTSVVEALKSEMELLKDLEHEKIVSYLGFEESLSHLSILLEYVPGGSVGRCLRKHGKFQEQVIQFFTVQMLEGLEYLHSRGILHRDLKADNILVKMDGTVKISDFGISKKSNDIYNNNSNMSMQGSIFWMAPEVVHNQKKGYSAKIDIWSLGCVVLEMFAGRRPWDSEEAIQAMFKLGAERLAPPIPKDVVLSSQASHFLKECFHADPDKRPMASRLLCHKFLTLDKSWDFHMSALYKAMTA